MTPTTPHPVASVGPAPGPDTAVSQAGASAAAPTAPASAADDEISLLDLALPLAEHWKLLIFGPLLVGLIALGVAFMLPHTYTARAVILPPQQQQGAAAAAMAQLGALAGMAGGAAGLRTPADQFVALMESNTVAHAIADAFELEQVYETELRYDTLRALRDRVSIAAGRQTGLITVEVQDRDPQRAAAMANRYVEELSRLTNQLAMTEAQQRRQFFGQKLAETRDRLAAAQTALKATGVDEAVVRTQPEAAVEAFAALRAQVTAAEVRVQSMRTFLTEQAPELQRGLAELAALRQQLARVENQRPQNTAASGAFINHMREFKYQETLFELFARQYEMARVDEAREGVLVQVVDAARAPERRSSPQRGMIAVLATLASGFALLLLVLVRHAWRNAAHNPETAAKMQRLQGALRWRQRSA